MSLESYIEIALKNEASDLHLEGGLPMALRVRGELRMIGAPVPPEQCLALARSLMEEDSWKRFLARRSFDMSRTILGVRCRINVLKSTRGVGLAIRLLSSFQPTLEKLNIHPEIRRLIQRPNGLIIVSGPTGSGKSSTMAALIHEINVNENSHVVTIENPIEYTFRPRRAFIRQREVGYDTPSFSQALIDVMREDPDVIMVGEMREPEVMRLTLNAAETGHLVLTTTHSSNVGEAVGRVVSAFPPEIQSGIASQLAECLYAVICQRLHYRGDLGIRVPELEVLISTPAVRNFIRQGHYFKVNSALETGAADGMWTFARYQDWLGKKKDWHVPRGDSEPPDSEERSAVEAMTPLPEPSGRPAKEATPGEVVDIQSPEESVDQLISELRFFRRE